MRVDARCPSCGVWLVYREDRRNAYLGCPSCGESVRVPVPVLARRYVDYRNRRVDFRAMLQHLYMLFLERLAYARTENT